MAKLANIARMTTATSGTGTVTLGSAVSGYITFANAGVANGDVVTYVIEEGANREIGRGTYTSSGTTLSRDTVLNSTNGGAKINLAGAATVFIDAAKEDIQETGQVIQVVSTISGAVASGSTQVPYDDTIPQNTEGDEYVTLAITPKLSTSKLRIDAVLNFATSANAVITAALFQDSTANALAASGERSASTNALVQVNLTHVMTAGTTSSTTFKIRAGPSAAATVTFNGDSTARRYGGVMVSSLIITEIRA